MTPKDIMQAIFYGAIALAVIIFVLILILNQFAPLKQCDDMNDTALVKFGKKWFTCGELRAINTTIATNEIADGEL